MLRKRKRKQEFDVNAHLHCRTVEEILNTNGLKNHDSDVRWIALEDLTRSLESVDTLIDGKYQVQIRKQVILMLDDTSTDVKCAAGKL